MQCQCNDHVHHVYDAIAEHFSDTRYKGWPVVEDYIAALPIGSIVGDIGCGNGKYMGPYDHLAFLGCDRSGALMRIAHERGHDVQIADGLCLPYRSCVLDHALSIAVIHHFATPARRRAALAEIARVLRPGGTALVFAWALEQVSRKRAFAVQDNLVTWKTTARQSRKAALPEPASAPNDRTASTYERFYHMFVQGELQALAAEVPALDVIRDGYDRDNWWVVVRRRA
ncbi:hypothetical protein CAUPRSCDRAFT_10141 [Caulochytrium protostelioides]|uniref:Methyltransferase type 11 domain-containing protein n=1 Tax=Caulochytrium protostelioides TaxID=1555241 RepID=A0A4P9WTQ2_9FUNG|nr:hypothetical protein CAUPRSCDRAFT_10141 [Caulochytrium protostelioides]